MGVVLFLSRDFVQLSLTRTIVNQRPFNMDLAETVYKNNSLIYYYNSSNYPNSSSDFPHINRSIAEINPTEVRHIGFLKVHKAGSTTMQNMLFRFGLKRNLTFVIPRTGNYFNVSPTLPVKKGGQYDILAIHTNAFDKGQFDKILPPDKVDIGIVREPLDRMISAAYYYRDVFGVGHLRTIPKANFIQELVTHPEKYDRGAFSVTKNSMGKDFGFESNTRESDIDKILQKLKFLEKEFRLVLVVERFEESLILMKRYLGWQISDILFIPSNTHEHAATNLTDEQKLKHKHTCFLDYAIYDFFSKIYDYKVQAEGPGFQDEVRQFKNVLQQTKTFCDHSKQEADKQKVKATEWNSEFEVSHSDCELMQLGEIKFLQRLRTRHIQMNR